jgi:VIT1/CCC1 family predicted Fe2+/Mn2+ transporter
MEDRTTLSRRSKRLRRHGSRWLLGGGVAALIGVLLMIAFDGFLEAAGLMLASLATAPIVVGLGLWLSGATGRWVSRERPFA